MNEFSKKVNSLSSEPSQFMFEVGLTLPEKT